MEIKKQKFGHEKLIVYRKGLEFSAFCGTLLNSLSRRVAARDQLTRASESILVNIAYASSSWSPKDRIVYLGHANGSALECAGCLDVLVAKSLLTSDAAVPGKKLLVEIISILIAMRKTTADRVSENYKGYRTKQGNFFNHEDLIVYQTSIQLVTLLESMIREFVCSADLLAKLDKATTSIVLNIAEGNGRFTEVDQVRFFEIAYKSTVQTASLLDLVSARGSADVSRVDQAREQLREIAAMLASLSKVVVHDT